MIKQKEKLTILVPFMNREENLKVFIPYIRNFMETNFPQINYDIVVIEQDNDKKFNKGILFNVGFLLTSGSTDYYALHDVDQLPVSADYRYVEKPNHLCVNCIEQSTSGDIINTYKDEYLQKGGCIIIDKHLYEKTNGHSNKYWGWGGIDDDFAVRLELVGYFMNRYNEPMSYTNEKNTLGYYITLNAKTLRYENDPNFAINSEHFFNFIKNREMYKTDGLNDIKFELLETINENGYIRYKITF